MTDTTCKKCGHSCHCVLDKREHRLLSDCICAECKCQQDRNEDASYENNSGLVIDDTDGCESCQ